MDVQFRIITHLINLALGALHILPVLLNGPTVSLLGTQEHFVLSHCLSFCTYSLSFLWLVRFLPPALQWLFAESELSGFAPTLLNHLLAEMMSPLPALPFVFLTVGMRRSGILPVPCAMMFFWSCFRRVCEIHGAPCKSRPRALLG